MPSSLHVEGNTEIACIGNGLSMLLTQLSEIYDGVLTLMLQFIRGLRSERSDQYEESYF